MAVKKSKKSANKSTATSTIKSNLEKEVQLPVPLPKNKVGAFLGKNRKIKVPKYFKESWQELRKVTWPSRKETWKLVFAVIVFTLIFTGITALADVGFRELLERVLI